MRFPLDLLPMALCGLATIVAVAIILVVGDLLRRFVLNVIGRVERARARPPPPTGDASPRDGKVPKAVSPSETLPG